MTNRYLQICCWQKRFFDIFFSSLGLLVFSPLILFAWLGASLATRSNGFFLQRRVGRYGVLFTIVKIKTMRPKSSPYQSDFESDLSRITAFGSFLRKYKIDELPQFLNVLVGDMSFVGPRPDIPGFADRLQGPSRLILQVRPGITGPASLKYRDEESLLASQSDPEAYNYRYIWPDKVRINMNYINNWSFRADFICLYKTLFR